MRSTGQLTDNVTEARLLQRRIMEMSRERYKYITQTQFNKKFFLTSQQRKTRLMPKLLQGVDAEYWLSQKTSRHVPVFSTSSAGNARFAFLDRLQKQGEKCKDFEEEEDNPFAIPSKPKIPEKKQLPEFYRIRLKEQEESELAKATFPTQPLLRPMTQKSVNFCNNDSKRNAPKPSSSQPAPKHTVRPSTLPDKRAHLRRTQSSRSPLRVVDDTRYTALESLLCNKYTTPEELDPERLRSIIHAHDSLHVPSRQSINARPKLQKTILEYLRSRGFDV
ncbi:uncharacterized protein [Watersipora subatra]|uniref:uncharacterized protein n=1 Tax=Watersipora subatra TaxID=2589382 RepID=UPI00355B65D2